LKYYSESADLGNVQAQVLLSTRNKEISRRGSHRDSAYQSDRNDLETSLGQFLKEEEHSHEEYGFKNKPSSLGRNLERLGVTVSTLPTSQYIKDARANPYSKNGNVFSQNI